ncbi:hypothetical protein KIW84_073566 [Lathyrus oleraceus]|uniref:Retrovirus-related Pol polyprotein from transposon TNT 1-94-like beta-barrel domain-containing protein n=1 Tax=Pisum sativum TaxID=3888 RepID=A0A9D4VQD0_PEA|nr:hypothetical protein KIW84_073566 [Pisum sativum]
MENNNNIWPSPSQAYTGSNHGEQPQLESGVSHRNGGGRRNGVQTRNLDEGRRSDKASNSDQWQQPPLSQFLLTTEQLDRLYKLLESPTPSCSIATKGKSAFLNVSLSHTWIVDSGVSDHMAGESTMFSSYSPCACNQKIKIADGSFSAIASKESVVLSPMLTLKNVLHVPNLSCNLMFVSKLAQDINCQTNFFRSHKVFQDLNSGKMIGSAKESGGLYYLDIGSASQLP